MAGIALESGSRGVPPKKHVHVRTEDWQITSDTPMDESLLSCDLLPRSLPGKLGCYILPKDSVLTRVNGMPCDVAYYQSLLSQESTRTELRRIPDIVHHITVSSDILESEEEEEEDCHEGDGQEEEDCQEDFQEDFQEEEDCQEDFQEDCQEECCEDGEERREGEEEEEEEEGEDWESIKLTDALLE